MGFLSGGSFLAIQWKAVYGSKFKKLKWTNTNLELRRFVASEVSGGKNLILVGSSRIFKTGFVARSNSFEAFFLTCFYFSLHWAFLTQITFSVVERGGALIVFCCESDLNSENSILVSPARFKRKKSFFKTHDTVLTRRTGMKETDRNLLAKTEKLVREERRITAEILECLSEIESKMIYAALAYSSLYEFCVKHLKYSEGSVHRRISAMRLLKTLPERIQIETKSKIASGAITVSNLSVVHGFIKTEKKETGKNYSAQEKISLIQNIEDRSKLEVEKQLAAIQPKIIPLESKRILTETLTEIKFVADETLMKKLERVKQVAGSVLPGTGIAEMISRLADEYLKKHDPMLKMEKNKRNATEMRKFQ